MLCFIQFISNLCKFKYDTNNIILFKNDYDLLIIKENNSYKYIKIINNTIYNTNIILINKTFNIINKYNYKLVKIDINSINIILKNNKIYNNTQSKILINIQVNINKNTQKNNFNYKNIFVNTKKKKNIIKSNLLNKYYIIGRLFKTYEKLKYYYCNKLYYIKYTLIKNKKINSWCYFLYYYKNYNIYILCIHSIFDFENKYNYKLNIKINLLLI